MSLIRSRFNHNFSGERNTILFNAVTEAIYVFSNEDYKIYSNDFMQLNSSVINELKTNGFIVDSEIEEFKRVEFSRAKRIFDDGDRIVTILTTTACNARCHYCYEAGMHFITMSQDTAKDTIEFLKGFVVGCNHITLYWFGGEPLLNYKVIDYISEKMIKYCSEKNIEYEARMYTNGSLLDSSILEKLKPKWKISSIQITIDGYGNTYDAIKKYQNTNFGYSDIKETIRKITNLGIHVSVRFNIDKLNFNSILVAAEDLLKHIEKKRKVSFYIAPLYEFKDAGYNKALISTNEIADYYCRFIDKLKSIGYIEGYNYFDIGYSSLNCYASSLNGIVIDPKGDICKCQHCAGVHDQNIGNVRSGLVFNDVYAKWCSLNLSIECMKCSYLPVCQGGCLSNDIYRETSFGKCPLDRYVLKYKLKYILEAYEQNNCKE